MGIYLLYLKAIHSLFTLFLLCFGISRFYISWPSVGGNVKSIFCASYAILIIYIKCLLKYEKFMSFTCVHMGHEMEFCTSASWSIPKKKNSLFWAKWPNFDEWGNSGKWNFHNCD
jgi:hypothetical protein